MTMRRRALPLAVVAVMLIPLVSAPARAGDNSYSSVVKHIKATYRAKQQGFFGAMMFARFAVKVVRPAGVKNFKLVMLKNLDFSDRPGHSQFHSAARRMISNEWQPLVQYNSRKNNQYTHVYVQHDKDHVKLLVVALQQREAFVLQTKFSPEKLLKFIDDPRIMGISLKDKTNGNDRDTPDDDRDDPDEGDKKPVKKKTDGSTDFSLLMEAVDGAD